MLTYQQLYELYYEGPDVIFKFIENLYLDIDNKEQLLGHQQQMTINDLSRRLAKVNKQLIRVKSKLATKECLVYELTRRLQQAQKALVELQQRQQDCPGDSTNRSRDSRNSNLPPSSDSPAVKAANSLRRTRSLRRKTGNSVGGQVGHPGRTLLRVEEPDRIIVHSPEVCRSCWASLSDSPVVKREKRQVFDLPPVKVEVIEHLVETRKCVTCTHKTKAGFPVRVKAPVQYGEGVRARAIYLQKYQLLPFERTSEAMRELFGCGIRASTLHNAREKCSHKLIETEARIKAGLQGSAVIGVDETGVRVGGRGQWIHVARTDELTHYAYDARRGKAAMDAIAILPEFRGKMVHDGMTAYERYCQCKHSLCNAHLLRELVYVGEGWPKHREWSGGLIKLLLEIKEEVERARQTGQRQLSQESEQSFIARYEKLVEQAIKMNSEVDSTREKEASEQEQSVKAKPRDPTAGLLRRLDERREEVLRFMTDLEVLFDNNATERDLRMVKLQQKVGGCFRTPEGAETFCRIRSYLSTARKQGHSLLVAIERVLRDKPFIFSASKS